MAAVKEDLSCSICLDPCEDPVSLPCGHRFCRVCISYELDTQKSSEVYFCPQCKTQFMERPPMLHKKRRLHAVETVPCTYCDDPAPAEKTCLHCDASLCAKHLTKHSTAPEHVLIEPTATPEDRKCTEHRQLLNHYCTEDGAFICLLCYVAGDHKGHEVVSLNINSAEEGKGYLIPIIKNLRKERYKTEDQIRSLQAQEAAQGRKTDDCKRRVVFRIQTIKKDLEVLQKKVLNEVNTQKKEVSDSIFEWKKKLEMQRQELSIKIDHVEKLFSISDSLTFIKKVLATDLVGIFNVEQMSGDTFDETPISEMLYKELLQFSDGLNKQILKDAFPKMKKSEITLDVKTAHCKINITDDLRSAIYTEKRQTRDTGSERFRSHHVLSECSLSSGNHYWEVEMMGTQCSIGIAYNNMDRKSTKHDSHIGYNERSWGLDVDTNLSVWHNNVKTQISTDSPVRSFGIFLEYEVGRLSFYQLCDPIRHLHTFTTTFTDPLNAAFYVYKDSGITILK
ncbi:putative tripartite motif-containing protein 75 [Rana temporaria]|uniref:putative tripartite motif-containing protein 75 n=1 Tax=Rana temporaria TaxID=8407 RepID=UPI001AAC4B60|nr:putative tripartite motif-containing protein 75 [Rana temporaria]